MAALPKSRNIKRLRRGQSLVEFAVVALVSYMLFAGIVTFGFYFYAAQSTQAVVDLAAREISRTPLPAAGLDLKGVLEDGANSNPDLEIVRSQVFDKHYLVLNEADVLLPPPQGGLNREFIGRLPIINQQLIPLMISDQVNGVKIFRYPGAIFVDTNPADNPADPAPSGFLVSIPLINSRSATGVETIEWVPVLEPILMVDEDQFPITSTQRGIVALRINYPVQSAVMTSFRHNTAAPDYPFEPTIGNPNLADDGGVTVAANPNYTPEGTLTQSDFEYRAYSGTYGLGKQAAFAQQVRPFRRVISAQAIYRREIFQ
jgi:hypothetical protein